MLNVWHSSCVDLLLIQIVFIFIVRLSRVIKKVVDFRLLWSDFKGHIRFSFKVNLASFQVVIPSILYLITYIFQRIVLMVLPSAFKGLHLRWWTMHWYVWLLYGAEVEARGVCLYQSACAQSFFFKFYHIFMNTQVLLLFKFKKNYF